MVSAVCFCNLHISSMRLLSGLHVRNAPGLLVKIDTGFRILGFRLLEGIGLASTDMTYLCNLLHDNVNIV